MELSEEILGNILIMDDEEMIRVSTGQLLEIMGYNVYYSIDGDEALKVHGQQLTSSSKIDIIIMDLTIPNGMGGIDCISKIREVDSDVQAVVSSGDPTHEVFENFSNYGFNYALAKPYTLDTIKSMLEKMTQ